MSSQTKRIIIGIHLGTEYTRVAWVNSSVSSLNQRVHLISEWSKDGMHGGMNKVPSEIFYPQDPSGPVKWGYEVDKIRQSGAAGTILRHIKLLLDPTQFNHLFVYVEEMRARIPQGKAPVDVVTDYLACIKAHTLSVLSRALGSMFWKVIPVVYYLTIPVLCNESTRSLLLQAAHRAGIGSEQNLTLITEPQAAASCYLQAGCIGLLKVCDNFIVMDCGSGTVGLTTYEILERNPRLQAREIGVPTTRLCGSNFLNPRFEYFIRRRLGDQIIDDMFRRGKPYKTMMRDFEGRLKLTFKDSPDHDLMDCNVGGMVPDDESKRVEDGYLEITKNEMQEIFDPVIDEICQYVQEQIDAAHKGSKKKISAVLMVGGFSASPYLQQKLSNHIITHYGDGIMVLQPQDSSTAIVRGAVVAGLENSIYSPKISRIARYSLGIKYPTTWESGIHPLHDKVWDPYSGDYKCTNYIQWIIKRGDEVEDQMKISSYLHCVLPIHSPLQDKQVIYSSTSSPTELANTTSDPSVTRLCNLHIDLSGLREKLTASTNSKGESVYKIDYELLMKYGAASLAFELRYNGVIFGNVAIQYV